MAKFQKGNSGRPKGAVNKITKTVRETVLQAFNEIQDDPKTNIIAFAKKYPKDFYNIAAKLIPTDLKAEISGSQELIVKFEEIKTYETPNSDNEKV